jgi:predicted DNA-binding antitoxin AbrB/MazE fold protein
MIYCQTFRGNGAVAESLMDLSVEATYENGVLKPASPLPLTEHERVRVVIRPAISRARQTAGLVKWTGDPEALRRLTEDSEFGILESP